MVAVNINWGEIGLLLQSVPKDSGSQSDADVQNRKNTLGLLENPSVSVKAKIRAIENYFRFQEGMVDASNKFLQGKNAPKEQSTPSSQQGSKYQILEVSE